jgi:hypothetical protein
MPSRPLHDIPPLVPSVIITISVLFLYFIHKDYRKFLSLGSGGTPSNFRGYIKITFLRLFALRNPYCPDPTPTDLGSGFLLANVIPERTKDRPIVEGIAPHRQTNQHSPPSVFQYLLKSIEELANSRPTQLRIGTSAFEKHCLGLFCEMANLAGNGEVCHAHEFDGSLHMTLHPRDIETVLDARWGGKWSHLFHIRILSRSYIVTNIYRASSVGSGWLVEPFRSPGIRNDLCTSFL